MLQGKAGTDSTGNRRKGIGKKEKIGSLEHAKNIALRFLSHRARTSKEVEKKLREKQIDDEMICEVLSILGRLKLIDDRSYAAEWVDYRSKNKFMGPLRLLEELEKKGISKELREKAVGDCFQELEEKEQAFIAAKKKINQSGGLEEEKLKRRVFLYLKRKGFSSEAVYSTVNKLIR